MSSPIRKPERTRHPEPHTGRFEDRLRKEVGEWIGQIITVDLTSVLNVKLFVTNPIQT
jgi:hypothetical protein